MANFGGRGSRGPRRTGRPSYGRKTRRGGNRSSKRSNLGRWGIGLGIAAGGAIAVAGALHGYSGVSHSVKTLVGDFKAAKKWASTRKASKAVLAASTVKFNASRAAHMKILRGGPKPKMFKFRSNVKTKFKVRRHGKR